MGAFTMPMHGTAMPPAGGLNMNPTGANGTGGTTTAQGTIASPVNPFSFSPPTGSPGTYGYGTSGNPNPTGTAAPTMNPSGTATPPVASSGTPLSTQFGATGNELQSFLASNAGYNSALTQQAVQAQTAEMQLQANQNYGNLQSGLGAAGINPNSSAAALESSNFWSNTATAENAMTAQEYMSMWQSSMSNETGVLESIAGPAGAYQENYYNQNNTTAMDWLGVALQGSESGAMMGLMAAGAI